MRAAEASALQNLIGGGSDRWKRLQRWNYALFALVLLHGVAFHVIEKRKIPFVVALSVLVITSVLLQLQGYRRRRAARRATGGLASHVDDVAA